MTPPNNTPPMILADHVTRRFENHPGQRVLEELQFAVLEWVYWSNHRLLLEPMG